MIKQGRAYFLLVLVGSVVFYTAQAMGASISQLQTLYQQKQYDDAYQMALELEAEQGGDASFDFTFGMVALETQHFDRAVFAFERVLMLEPYNYRVRLELARTHYFLV